MRLCSSDPAWLVSLVAVSRLTVIQSVSLAFHLLGLRVLLEDTVGVYFIISACSQYRRATNDYSNL